MRTKLSSAAVVTAIATILSSCLGDGHDQIVVIGRSPVRFSTTIATTRAYDNLWEPGDRIGVYMIDAGAQWSQTNVIGNNALYTHALEQNSATATFSGEGEDALFWPEDGGRVDFVAYYPYLADGIEEYVLPLDVSDQSSPKAIDLMTARLDNVAAANENLSLMFQHRLSRLRFNITDAEGALVGMSASLSGLPAVGSYDLASDELTADPDSADEPIGAIATTTSDKNGVVTAIVLPGDDLDYSLVIELADGKRAVFNVTGADFEGGKQYIYNLTLTPGDDEPVEVGFGELTGISGWDDGDPGDYDPELPKENESGGEGPGSGEAGTMWASGILSPSPSPAGAYSIGGTPLFGENGMIVSPQNEATITKSNYNEGIAGVSISAGSAFDATGSLSVMVGETEMVYGEGEATQTSANVEESEGDYLFLTPGGSPLTGTVTITVEALSGNVTVESFTINP